jgi:hypothetical protein
MRKQAEKVIIKFKKNVKKMSENTTHQTVAKHHPKEGRANSAKQVAPPLERSSSTFRYDSKSIFLTYA